MKYQRRTFIVAFTLLFPLLLCAQQKTDSLQIVKVNFSIQHISDIDFVKQEYKMELWLKFFAKDSSQLLEIEDQIAIKDAKKIHVDTNAVRNNEDQIVIKDAKKTQTDTIGGRKKSKWNKNKQTNIVKGRGGLYIKELRINCTMIKKWDLDGYPFDKQNLDIIIYNADDPEYFRFARNKDNDSINYNDTSRSKIEIENGWVFIRNSAKLQYTTINDPFNPFDTLKYSAMEYHIPVYREQQWGLFSKLLLGMYVAFFVAYISLFITIKETHARFDLPVGGLFAAIANKYIIDSILPQSPEFSLVDWLHSITIVFILIIIAYSAIRLYVVITKPEILAEEHASVKNRKHNSVAYNKTSNKFFIWGLTIVYVLLNLILIRWGCTHIEP